MVRCKSLSSLKPFLWYAPQPSGASIVSSSWAHSGLTSSPCWQWMQSPVTMTSFVYWYGRRYSISQFLLSVWNLTNIWETFNDQFLSHGAGRFVPIWQKFLWTCHSRWYFPIRLCRYLKILQSLWHNFPCCFFSYLESQYYNHAMWGYTWHIFLQDGYCWDRR